jgi:hypothetical protein
MKTSSDSPQPNFSFKIGTLITAAAAQNLRDVRRVLTIGGMFIPLVGPYLVLAKITIKV